MISKYVCDTSGGEGCDGERNSGTRGTGCSYLWGGRFQSGEGGLRAGSGVLGPGRQMGLLGGLAEGRGRVCVCEGVGVDHSWKEAWDQREVSSDFMIENSVS